MTNDKLMKRSICLFCSLGCSVAFKTAGDQVMAIDYDRDNPVNGGALCPRGHYNFELLNHPARLTKPQIGSRQVSWAEALTHLGHKLKEFNPDSVGIVISGNSSNEDAYIAAKLAKVLGIKNIVAAVDPADLEAYQGEKSQVEGAGLASLEDLDNSEALLIIGDILTRSPVLAKRINKVKYGKRGNQIIVVDPNKTHTAWFATQHLRNKPGTEAMLLSALIAVLDPDKAALNLDTAAGTIGVAKEEIEKAAKALAAAASGTIIISPASTMARNDLIVCLAKVLASLTKKKYITYYGHGNVLGVNTILDQVVGERSGYTSLLTKIDNGQIKALLMLGEDITASSPEQAKKIRHLKFLAMSNYFTTDSVEDAVLLLPLASHLECEASYLLAGGRLERSTVVAKKVGGKSNLEIVAALLNTEMDWQTISRETAEVLKKGISQAAIKIGDKVAEVPAMGTQETVPEMNITHFGNNSLVKNFYWYRAING
ncbi:MAG: molybdopterin-dependent oxidoreductase [bacterium]